jgi:hypothetical protein
MKSKPLRYDRWELPLTPGNSFKKYFEAFCKASQKLQDKYWLPKERKKMNKSNRIYAITITNPIAFELDYDNEQEWLEKVFKPRLRITRNKDKLYVWVKKSKL